MSSMNFSYGFGKILLICCFVLAPLAVAQELPVEPEPVDKVGPVLDCYIQTAPLCVNFVVPIADKCVGQCVDEIVYNDQYPNGHIATKCPTPREESNTESLVMRARALTAPSNEVGLDDWEEVNTVDCIEYHFCLCKPDPDNAVGPQICYACDCEHTDNPVEQSVIKGANCNQLGGGGGGGGGGGNPKEVPAGF